MFSNGVRRFEAEPEANHIMTGIGPSGHVAEPRRQKHRANPKPKRQIFLAVAGHVALPVTVRVRLVDALFVK